MRKTATASRGKSNRKRSQQQKRRKAKKQIKEGVQQALYGFYTISLIFVVLFLISLGFLLYQWKEYQIVEYGKEIQQLRTDIYRLNSLVNHNEAQINTELLKYYRIARIAREKLNLVPSIQEPIVFEVDKEKLEDYARKDQKAQD